MVTPDIAATYNNDKNLMFIELKWSLPMDEELLKKELLELEKYTVLCSQSGNTIECQELVLICHIDDAQRIVEMIKKLSSNYPFLSNDGFSVWSWSLSLSKYGERKEEMRLFSVYGKSYNHRLQMLITQPGGILFPEEALTYLRFMFTFIKEKPPIQYTITVLIQNILSSFQRGPERESQDIHIDMIYERAKSFFPSWHKYDATTIQVKRKWIVEALEQMNELRICQKIANKEDWWKIRIPLISTRKPVQHVICKKLAKSYLKQASKNKGGRPKSNFSRPKANAKDKSITSFF